MVYYTDIVWSVPPQFLRKGREIETAATERLSEEEDGGVAMDDLSEYGTGDDRCWKGGPGNRWDEWGEEDEELDNDEVEDTKSDGTFWDSNQVENLESRIL